MSRGNTEAEIKAEHEQWVEDYHASQRAEFEKEREGLDADYNALPPTLRKRIDLMRAQDPDFRWQSESYEMFVCTQAAAIAEWAENHPDPVGALAAWKKLPFAEQREQCPALDDRHSGNTFGCAVALANMLLTSRERAAVAPPAMPF